MKENITVINSNLKKNLEICSIRDHENRALTSENGTLKGLVDTMNGDTKNYKVN